MKKFLLGAIALTMVTGITIFIACNKNNEEANEAVRQKGPAAECCSVECKNGKCSASASPCKCECTWWGNPVCSGGSGSGSNSVFTSKLQLARFDMIVEFINNANDGLKSPFFLCYFLVKFF